MAMEKLEMRIHSRNFYVFVYLSNNVYEAPKLLWYAEGKQRHICHDHWSVKIEWEKHKYEQRSDLMCHDSLCRNN